jgi:hypothetical protein
MDLWLREDVVRILASTHETMRSTVRAAGSQATPAATSYQQGFTDALRAVGLGFGLALVDTNEGRGSGTICSEGDMAPMSNHGGGGQWSSMGGDSDLKGSAQV